MFSSIKLVRKLHRPSYSLLSIKLSCENFLYNLSVDSIVCWFFSYCFLYLLRMFIIISFSTLLPIDNPHAVAVDNGFATKPISVSGNVLEPDVVAVITNVSNDFSIVVKDFYFFLLF